MARTNHISRCELIDKVARRLLKAGWIREERGVHVRLTAPGGALTVTVPVTPSDHRSGLNWISQIRRAGVPPELLKSL